MFMLKSVMRRGRWCKALSMKRWTSPNYNIMKKKLCKYIKSACMWTKTGKDYASRENVLSCSFIIESDLCSAMCLVFWFYTLLLLHFRGLRPGILCPFLITWSVVFICTLPVSREVALSPLPLTLARHILAAASQHLLLSRSLNCGLVLVWLFNAVWSYLLPFHPAPSGHSTSVPFP